MPGEAGLCPARLDSEKASTGGTSEFFGRFLSLLPAERMHSESGRQFFLYKCRNRILEFGVRCKVESPDAPHHVRGVEKSRRSGFDLLRVTLNLARGDLEDSSTGPLPGPIRHGRSPCRERRPGPRGVRHMAQAA